MNERLKLSGDVDYTLLDDPWSEYYYDEDYDDDGDDLSVISNEDEFDLYGFYLNDDSEDIVIEGNNINNFDKMVI